MSHAHYNEQSLAQPLQVGQAPHYERIVGEVCARLVELWLLNPTKTYRWLQRLEALMQLERGRDALFWYLFLQSGDFAALTDSLSVIGAQRWRSKQAVQQELARACADIVGLFPELTEAIRDMRRSVRDYTQPVDRKESI